MQLPPPDPRPYGLALAERVAAALQAGSGVYFQHRDYCGMGLWFEEGCFCYDEIYDCGPYPLEEVKAKAAGRGGRVFGNRQDFVTWLAAQSDHSLAGLELKNEWLRQNQRITRERLERVLNIA